MHGAMHSLVAGLISVEEWMEGFAGLPESDPSTQPMLASLELPPIMVSAATVPA